MTGNVMHFHLTDRPSFRTLATVSQLALFTVVRDETAETPRETGAWSREAGQRPAWEIRRGCAPFVGILQGGWPPCKSGRGRLQSRAREGGSILETVC
jgi:hypothetical protein